MSEAAVAAPAPLARRPGFELGPALSRGMVAAYLSIVVIVPLAAVTWKSGEDGVAGFWDTVASRHDVDRHHDERGDEGQDERAERLTARASVAA